EHIQPSVVLLGVDVFLGVRIVLLLGFVLLRVRIILLGVGVVLLLRVILLEIGIVLLLGIRIVLGVWVDLLLGLGIDLFGVHLGRDRFDVLLGIDLRRGLDRLVLHRNERRQRGSAFALEEPGQGNDVAAGVVGVAAVGLEGLTVVRFRLFEIAGPFLEQAED